MTGNEKLFHNGATPDGISSVAPNRTEFDTGSDAAKILLVATNPNVVAAVEESFSAAGYVIEAVSCASEALAAISATPPFRILFGLPADHEFHRIAAASGVPVVRFDEAPGAADRGAEARRLVSLVDRVRRVRLGEQTRT